LIVGALLGVVFVVSVGVLPAQEGPPAGNPFAGSVEAAQEGKALFAVNCGTCHGEDAKGNMCPDLTLKAKRYGNADADLFLTISQGRPGGMPNWEKKLGAEKIWKLITFLRSVEEK
jgi:cytochrome c oxidase cbb3-type subunit 3